MAYQDQEHCTSCGKPIPKQPEDASPDELLCDACFVLTEGGNLSPDNKETIHDPEQA